MKLFQKVISLCWICATLVLLTVAPALADTAAPKAPVDAKAYIISPGNNAQVASSFDVQFGLSGMGVAPAGVDAENTGHHHLLIDVDTLPDLDRPLPKTEQIKHFGGGQTETQLSLEPGKHTLQLLLGNYQHIPHDQPVVSDKVTVIVQN